MSLANSRLHMPSATYLLGEVNGLIECRKVRRAVRAFNLPARVLPARMENKPSAILTILGGNARAVIRCAADQQKTQRQDSHGWNSTPERRIA